MRKNSCWIQRCWTPSVTEARASDPRWSNSRAPGSEHRSWANGSTTRCDLGFQDCYRDLDGFGDLLWFGIQLPDLLFNHGHNPSRWWFVNGFNGGSLCVEWSPIKMAFFTKGISLTVESLNQHQALCFSSIFFKQFWPLEKRRGCLQAWRIQRGQRVISWGYHGFFQRDLTNNLYLGVSKNRGFKPHLWL